MEIQNIVAEVKEKEIKIEELNQNIKVLFEDNGTRLSESKNIVTHEIQENYKKIESTFSAKSKLESDVQNMKKKILSTLFL